MVPQSTDAQRIHGSGAHAIRGLCDHLFAMEKCVPSRFCGELFYCRLAWGSGPILSLTSVEGRNFPDLYLISCEDCASMTTSSTWRSLSPHVLRSCQPSRAMTCMRLNYHVP